MQLERAAMHWIRVRTITLQCIVVAAVVVAGFFAGGAVLGIALGAGVAVAVFSEGNTKRW